mgnify:CR=1 FL=1
MKIYICLLKLCDFLTFSSTIGFATIGGVSYTVYKPQPYIHNYALMYGFSGLLHVSLASPAKEIREIDYRFLNDIERKIYVYPARPRKLVIKRMLLNIKGEGLVETQLRPKSIYPWHVAHVYFGPGSVFETVLLVFDDSFKIPRNIRIGVKRQGVFTVECREAIVKNLVNGFTDPVNLGDILKSSMNPDSYVVLLSTRTRRRNVPYSNVIVKAYYKEPRIHLLSTSIDGREVEFRVPLLSVK